MGVKSVPFLLKPLVCKFLWWGSRGREERESELQLKGEGKRVSSSRESGRRAQHVQEIINNPGFAVLPM